jgi:hypothetical protein
MHRAWKRSAGLIGASLGAALWMGCGGATVPGSPGSDGGVHAYEACTGPGQCLALVPGCCGGCGAPTLGDVAGVNSTRVDEFRAATCGDPHPACPACPTMLEPNLIAFCQTDRCTPLDVRKDDLSACSQDADCMLRDPACCEACNPQPFGLIAIAKAKAAEYRAQACTPSQACPRCAPVYPEGWAAVCSTDGHCQAIQRNNVCPAMQPNSGDACTLDPTVTCEYGDDNRPGCRARVTCSAGVWQTAVPSCLPLPAPGEQGCPTVTSTDSCPTDGLACDLGNDSVCVCTACSGPCSQFPRWACSVPPTTAGCSARPPQLGSACSTENLVCTYGPMCAPPFAAARRCKDGAWIDEPIACPV